ncbi:MAG TPA: helix-turn-helix domain-containing protein [Vitreimonas sp.]|nr:helix-turn-helix domain-containing protein [Vitreimonas sp.]
MNLPLIYTFMSQLGVSQREVEIYLELLKTGPTSILYLSKVMEMPRTTIHQNVESLINKGLVIEQIIGSKRKIAAEPPAKISAIIKDKELALEKKATEIGILQENYHTVISQLKTITTAEDTPQTKVMIVEGKQNISRLYSELLKSKQIKAYCSVSEITEIFPNNFEKFLEASNKGALIWDLIEEKSYDITKISHFSKYPNYHYKFFPVDLTIECMDYLLYDDTITTIQGGKNPSAIIIKSPLLYKNAVRIFDSLWNFLPEPNLNA